MKRQAVDTPFKGSWADQQTTNPTIFTPSAHPTFQEADKLKLAQDNYPCWMSPQRAAEGKLVAETMLKGLP